MGNKKSIRPRIKGTSFLTSSTEVGNGGPIECPLVLVLVKRMTKGEFLEHAGKFGCRRKMWRYCKRSPRIIPNLDSEGNKIRRKRGISVWWCGTQPFVAMLLVNVYRPT